MTLNLHMSSRERLELLRDGIRSRCALLRQQTNQLEAQAVLIERELSHDRKAAGPAKPKRHLSPAGRKAIAAAQRARWARKKQATVRTESAKPEKRKISGATRRKMAAAQKRRFAEAKAKAPNAAKAAPAAKAASPAKVARAGA